MANYTEHYGLHQWVPEDDFLRTDFNADFALIDAALAGLAAADGAESQTRSQEDGALSAAITAGDNAQASALASAKTALQNAITSGDNAQASALAAAKEALEAADAALEAEDAKKAELFFGSYTGDSAASRTISLGFTPRAVYVCNQLGCAGMTTGSESTYGGLAFPNHPVVRRGTTAVEVVTGGFRVYKPDVYILSNNNTVVYHYMAVC